MARTITALTATQIKQAKPKPKEYKLSDGGGLYLLVTKSGGKHWKLKYKYEDKESKVSLGAYPQISLSKARELREQYKTDIANGINPNEAKREKKAKLKEEDLKNKNTLSNVADEFFTQIVESVTPKYHKKLKSYYDNHIKATLGTKPIKEVLRIDILSIVDIMQDKGIFESTKKTVNLLEPLADYKKQPTI